MKRGILDMKKLNVALVGAGFGGAFVGIWKHHPMVNSIGLYDTNPELLNKVAEHHGIEKKYSSFEEILADDTLDAVHLVTPIPLHEEQRVSKELPMLYEKLEKNT